MKNEDNFVLPEDMDIPDARRDISRPDNILWLFRNLFIRNSKHPKFEEVLVELRKRVPKISF